MVLVHVRCVVVGFFILSVTEMSTGNIAPIINFEGDIRWKISSGRRIEETVFGFFFYHP